MYHLTVNGKLYRDLRLSGETITRIFTGKIRDWSDPAITRDNNGRKLPSKRIVPVVRSDGSGTTAQFTLWMSKQYRSLWCEFYARCGLTSYYPTFGNAVAQSGSVQMAGYISASYGEGTIGYVEYSYAHNKNYPVAKLRNGAGYYVEPTDFNVAVALTNARINTDRNSPDYLTQVLDDVYRHPDKRAYPLSSYSYMILPTSEDRRITRDKGRSLSVFAHYFLCQGQQKAGPLGFSPLPLNLVRAGFEQVAKVPGAEGMALDPKGCDNPTFDPANPDSNRLAKIAPMPPECDRDGQGPCGGGVGAPAGGGSRPNGGGATQPSAGKSTGPGGAPGPATVDPVTGELVTGDAAGGAAGVVDVADSFDLTATLVALAAVEAAFLAFLPLFMARRLRRRQPR
jgi:ABC-type phosphate transport system substrate-binding protein